MRVRFAISDDFTLNNLLTLEHVQVTPLRNQLLMALARLIRDDEATLALGFLTEANRTRVLRHDRRLFRLTRFEQVGNSWQTTRDVTCLRRLLRNTCNDVTHRNFGTVGHRDDGTDRQSVNSRNVGVCEANIVAVCIDQFRNRTQIFARTTAALRIQYDNAGEAGELRPPARQPSRRQ